MDNFFLFFFVIRGEKRRGEKREKNVVVICARVIRGSESCPSHPSEFGGTIFNSIEP